MSTISVVVATYNGEKYIEEQLDTLRNQTVNPDEVIIGDDGSSDNTVKIVKDYIVTHNLTSWKQIVNSRNKGYEKNFLDLTLGATGDYIFLCDQDDLWEVNKIEKMSRILDEDNSISLLCSNLELFYDGEGGRKWDKKDLTAMKNDGSIEKNEFNYLNFFCQRSGCTMCVRGMFVHSIMPYWKNYWAHDDFIWKMAVLNGKCAIFHFASIKRRMHANNTSSMNIRTRKWRIEQIKKQLEQYQSFKEYGKKLNVPIEKINIIEDNVSCAKLRIQLLEKRNPLIWVKIFRKYKHCYPRVQAIILDLYLILFSQYKGVN